MVDQLIIMSLPRYLKPSADSGGTHSNLGLLPYTNAVVAAANKVVAVLSLFIIIATCFTCTNHEFITLLTYYCAVLVISSHVQVRKSLN